MKSVSSKMRLLFIITIGGVLVSSTTAELQKCCHQHQWLHEYEEVNTTQYRCNDETITCSNEVLCLDTTNYGNVIALNCVNNSFKTLDLDLKYKCCPTNMLYNIKTKTCELQLYESHSNFSNNLSVGIPHCDGTVVDITSQNLTYDTTGDILLYTDLFLNEERVVNLNESCMDVTTTYEIVLRTCVHKSVCYGISCVRKCCPDGKTYLRTTGRAKCVSMAHVSFEPQLFIKKDSVGK